MIKKITDKESMKLMDQGYGYEWFMGGCKGTRRDGLVVCVNGQDYFVDNFGDEYEHLHKQVTDEAAFFLFDRRFARDD
jgi:hypothetical protein